GRGHPQGHRGAQEPDAVRAQLPAAEFRRRRGRGLAGAIVLDGDGGGHGPVGRRPAALRQRRPGGAGRRLGLGSVGAHAGGAAAGQRAPAGALPDRPEDRRGGGDAAVDAARLGPGQPAAGRGAAVAAPVRFGPAGGGVCAAADRLGPEHGGAGAGGRTPAGAALARVGRGKAGSAPVPAGRRHGRTRNGIAA
ncbi:hypothetical protein KXX11_003627, partial [Aspergillus fumigatus]